MKKLIALVLALALVLLCVGAAMADNGSITIDNVSASQTYTLYKILDATYDGTVGEEGFAVVYTTKNPSLFVAYNNKDGESVACPFTVASTADSDGNYAVSSTATAAAIDAWITAAIYNSKFSSTGSQTPTTGNSITFSDLDYGYYYITSSLGSLVTINSAVPSTTVHDKNETEPGPPDKTDDEETAGIGDTVNFRVEFTATNYDKTAGDSAGTQITEYNVTDTPDGYDINVESLRVYVGATEITSLVTDEAVDATTGVLSFTIPWADAAGKSIYASPSQVVFTYSGVVNAAAKDGQADNTIAIHNNADTTPKTDTENSKNYKIEVIKVDNENTTLKLSGAEFQLYRGTQTAANLVKLVTDGSDLRVAYGATEIAASVTTFTVNEQITILGLDGNDTYILVETKAPEGYTLDPTPHNVTFKDNSGATVVYSDAEAQIPNTKGTLLPSTGGIGTTIFYILGGLLVVGAAVILVARRKAQD